jgi:predicted dehydrogenase
MAATQEKVRVGVIGTGQIGKAHLKRYSEIEEVEIVAVSDINQEEAQRVADQYSIPEVYTDFRELLKRDDIQAVDVCLHNNMHRPATVAGLEAGKHVFCEKPMAGSFVDAQAMWDTAQACGRNLSIQNNMLFENPTKAAKELIDGGQLGELYHARSTGFRRRGRPFVDGYGTPTFVQKRNSAGGALYDMGVYHIGVVLYLLGNPQVERISGKTYQKIAMDAARQEQSGYDVEELGLGFVRFANDATLDIIEAWAIHLDGIEGSSVVGTEGGVRLEPFGFFKNVGDLNLNSTVDLSGASFRWTNVHGRGDDFKSAQHHWIAALQGRVPLLPTAELALNTMLIQEGIYLSNDLRREVTADEVREASKSTALDI